MASGSSAKSPEAAAKRTKMDPSKSYKDLKESDFSMYDDISEPYMFAYNDFVYMNKAMKKLEEDIAEYRKQNRKLGPFDAIAPPPNSGILGAVVPTRVTDANRPYIIQLCNCALDKYNAENQDAKFEFAELVKVNAAVVRGLMYYITFEAKDPNGVTHTFQAKVRDRVCRDEKPEALLCMIKPT